MVLKQHRHYLQIIYQVLRLLWISHCLTDNQIKRLALWTSLISFSSESTETDPKKDKIMEKKLTIKINIKIMCSKSESNLSAILSLEHNTEKADE